MALGGMAQVIHLSDHSVSGPSFLVLADGALAGRYMWARIGANMCAVAHEVRSRYDPPEQASSGCAARVESKANQPGWLGHRRFVREELVARVPLVLSTRVGSKASQAVPPTHSTGATPPSGVPWHMSFARDTIPHEQTSSGCAGRVQSDSIGATPRHTGDDNRPVALPRPSQSLRPCHPSSVTPVGRWDGRSLTTSATGFSGPGPG